MQNIDSTFNVDNQYQATQPTAPLHTMDLNPKEGPSMSNSRAKLPLAIAALAVVAGILTGFGGAKLATKTSSLGGDSGAPIQKVATGEVNAGDVFGVQDEQTFKDSAEGYLEIGGIDGEGSHKLLRPGGISQTVYLTSSVTDLDKFKGMQVKVWGETNKGQKAGWLMDVGRVQIINPAAEAPVEE
ncbi:MAG TPA: hypothetical protein VD999_04760 [Vitreimonas sp.]|nr:hypothetical protein [Vitreimonas sp.]